MRQLFHYISVFSSEEAATRNMPVYSNIGITEWTFTYLSYKELNMAIFERYKDISLT